MHGTSMNYPELLTAEEIHLRWKLALQTNKETLGLEQLAAKVQLYQTWQHELVSQEVHHSFEATADHLLHRTIHQLTEIWHQSMERVIKLAKELENQGHNLRVKSFKIVGDQLMHQLMLVILTLKEQAGIQQQQLKLYNMLAGHFSSLIWNLHTSRKAQDELLHEMLGLLQKEGETFPAHLDFKLIVPENVHSEVTRYLPQSVFNLIFTQGLQSARMLFRTGQPAGMKFMEWNTLLGAALVQDIGLTMGWGLGTPRQHLLKGDEAEHQLAEHAGLGAALLGGLKHFHGIIRLVSEHHTPLSAKQFSLRTRLTTLEQQSTLLRMAIKTVHLLYHPIEAGMHLDFLPGIMAQQQMVKLLKQEETLLPQLVTPLLKVLNESEDQLLRDHLDKLLPDFKDPCVSVHIRVDSAHPQRDIPNVTNHQQTSEYQVSSSLIHQ